MNQTERRRVPILERNRAAIAKFRTKSVLLSFRERKMRLEERDAYTSNVFADNRDKRMSLAEPERSAQRGCPPRISSTLHRLDRTLDDGFDSRPPGSTRSDTCRRPGLPTLASRPILRAPPAMRRKVEL